MVQIIPAILTSSPDEFEEMMHSVESHFTSVHLDIADGIFVPNMTIKGIDELERVHTPLKITVHLMVQGPENVIDRWLNTGIEALIFHIESTSKADELISRIKSKGKKVGIAVNPETPAEVLELFVDKVDFIQFMTVDPGFYGSEFREEVLSKIKNFSQQYPDVEIQVDGGINLTTTGGVVEAGADVLVVGSYFFPPEMDERGQDIDEALENMKKVVS